MKPLESWLDKRPTWDEARRIFGGHHLGFSEEEIRQAYNDCAANPAPNGQWMKNGNPVIYWRIELSHRLLLNRATRKTQRQ